MWRQALSWNLNEVGRAGKAAAANDLLENANSQPGMVEWRALRQAEEAR
jgi:hypothetical protein